MVPVLPGGVELLVILLIMLLLLGVPLFLLVVGGFGFWQLSRNEDGDDHETVEELRRRVDEMEAQLADVDGRDDGTVARDGAAPDGDADRAGADAASSSENWNDRDGPDERSG